MAKRYFNNLDGLRFTAAVTVALSHLETLKQYRHIPFLDNRFFENAAQIAVTFFFVLSGFLIMWWFLEETNGNTSKINIHKFYINRMARTWPLYFFVVVASILISVINGTFLQDDLTQKRYVAYLFFLPNTADVFFQKDIYLSPTWSLAVEECFYFSFPLLLTRMRKQNIIKTLFILTAVFTVLSIFLSRIFLKFSSSDFLNSELVGILLPFLSVTGFILFFLGAIAAASLFYGLVPLSLYKNKKLTICVSILIAMLVFNGITFSLLTQQLYSLLFAGYLFLLARSNCSMSLLNNRVMIWAGKRSYAIYMLHMFFILRLINQGAFLLKVKNDLMSIFISWIVYLGGVLIAAHLSYKLFENPIRLGVRRLLESKKTKIES